LWFGTPSVGGLRDRARNGLLTVTASWYFDDAYLAYALGLDLTKWSSRADVVDKNQIVSRFSLAEKAMKELKKFREIANKKIDFKTKDKDEATKIWKEEYMDDWVKLSEKWKKQGIAYHKLHVSKQSQITRRLSA